jgi:outer membrane scaffolding protein for murein synthesis (MipA/OmpV family)
MKKFKLYGSSLAATAALLVSSSVAAQDIVPVEPLEEQNIVGLGVFAVPDFYGSSDTQAAVAPILRYNFGDKRYVQVLGPEIQLNLVERSDWRAGPLLRVRGRRDDDVDNEIVKRMRPIASATELGGFVAYHMPLGGPPLHKVVFSADIVANLNGVYNGATGNLKVNYIHPFSQTMGGKSLIGSIGIGMFFSSTEFQEKYFGITGSDLAFFPERAGVPYRPDSTLTSVKIPFSLSAQINPKWLVTFAGRYERLLGDAKDSPIVDRLGDSNQWAVGIAASYLF